MPNESDDPDTAFTAQYFAPLFAQVVWKETTKVRVCRLSTQHAEVYVRIRECTRGADPANKCACAVTAQMKVCIDNVNTPMQVGCGTALCPGMTVPFPATYGLSVVCHYSPQVRLR